MKQEQQFNSKFRNFRFTNLEASGSSMKISLLWIMLNPHLSAPRCHAPREISTYSLITSPLVTFLMSPPGTA
jgi:hypothetical protein